MEETQKSLGEKKKTAAVMLAILEVIQVHR